jgi:hypothetical protein
MPRKDEFQIGLEAILNNPKTSFLQNPHVFREIHAGSEMSLTRMIRHVGRGSKQNKPKPPTDKEKIEKRLDELDAKQPEN